MRTKQLWRAMLMGLALALALTAVAGAAPNKDKPPRPNPGESVAKSCEDNGGSAWVKGLEPNADGVYEWMRDPEKLYAIPACIDLPVVDAQASMSWKVTLTVDVGERPKGDVLVRLERAMHDGIYAEELMPRSAGDLTVGIQTLEATLTATPAEGTPIDTLVFVAMPAHRLNWTVLSVRVEPANG